MNLNEGKVEMTSSQNPVVGLDQSQWNHLNKPGMQLGVVCLIESLWQQCCSGSHMIQYDHQMISHRIGAR